MDSSSSYANKLCAKLLQHGLCCVIIYFTYFTYLSKYKNYFLRVQVGPRSPGALQARDSLDVNLVPCKFVSNVTNLHH